MTDAPVALKNRPRGRPHKSASDRALNARRVELLRQAARLFRAQGYAASTTREIAEAAGMQNGSPFYYFKSKGALLCEVMRDGMERALRSQEHALRALDSDTAPRTQLQVLIRQHLEVCVGADADFIPVMLLEWRALSPVQRARVTAQKDQYEGIWMPVLTALHASGALQVEPHIARLYIFGALNWAVRWFDPSGRLTLDDMAEQAVHLFLREDGPVDPSDKARRLATGRHPRRQTE
jgi:AcrR family transcriptional regulator